MGELRTKMLNKMELRNFSRRTITIYLYHMKELVRYYKKSPENISCEEIEKYLHKLVEAGKSKSGIIQAYSAIKYFYTEVLNSNWGEYKIPRPKTEKKLPVVLSIEEVRKIITSVKNQRDKIFLMMLYSSGMRLSEGLNLRISDIDSKRMEIRIEQGKGKKDRYTILSPVLLNELKGYYKRYQPQNLLFPGKNSKTINSSTIQRAFNNGKKKPESQKQQQYTSYGIVLQPIC